MIVTIIGLGCIDATEMTKLANNLHDTHSHSSNDPNKRKMRTTASMTTLKHGSHASEKRPENSRKLLEHTARFPVPPPVEEDLA